ncbi:serine/arginine repetitive matrix protein 1-like [Ixodes scapularis]
MASRLYQPGDRLLGSEPGDARRGRESDSYEYDIFPQLPPREAHPPKRWRYQEQDSPSSLSDSGWEAEDALRRPSQPKQASFWSTPSSRKPATPRGSAARSSEARSVHAEREPSESSKRADLPEASTLGVGRLRSNPRSLVASRRYQPGDRLLDSELGDARRRREPESYEYNIFPQLPPREAHPPKRWRYQEQDSPSLLSQASWEAEYSSRRPSQPKQVSFWSTPSSHKPATPRGSAARSSEARSVHAEREISESSKRAGVPEASTSGVGRRPSTPRSFGAKSPAERPRQAGREQSPQSSWDDEGPTVSASSVQRRSAAPEASAWGASRRSATPRSVSARLSGERPRQVEREPSPESSMDDEGPPVSASSVQRRSADSPNRSDDHLWSTHRVQVPTIVFDPRFRRSTPSSHKPATPRGSAARSSEARSVHAEREISESSKRAGVPEASTSGVGRRPSTPRSFGAKSPAERPRQAGREQSPQSSWDDEGPTVSASSVQRRSAAPEASAWGASRRSATPRSVSARLSGERPRQVEREPSPESSMDDEGPPVSASSVQRRSAGGTCESRCLESGVSTDPEPCGFARPRLAVRGFPVSGEKGILVVEPSPG